MNLWRVEHFFPHFLGGLLCTGQKVFNSSEIHLNYTEVTSYKIHIFILVSKEVKLSIKVKLSNLHLQKWRIANKFIRTITTFY